MSGKNKIALAFSKRRYEIAMAGVSKIDTFDESLKFLIEDESDFECMYAIRENYIDELLDLKIGESMYFQHDRSDKKSKGIIVRTN